MARNMGFDFGLNDPNTIFKHRNRWLFIIDNISASGVNCLPPSKSARPSISFKEIETQHLTETIYFPGKPDWKPINLVLYDLVMNQNPVLTWLYSLYDPSNNSAYTPSCDGFKEPQARLEQYDGCGTLCETFIYENIWPSGIEFGELDMSSSDVLTCDLTLRYDRAYVKSK